MQTDISYDNFLSKTIKSMQVDLSSQISMIIKLNLTDDKSNVCTI